MSLYTNHAQKLAKKKKPRKENYNPVLAKLPTSIWSYRHSHVLLLGDAK